LGVDEIPNERAPVYAVQVGSFNQRENAERLLGEVKEVFREAYMAVWETPQGSYYRVRVGHFKSEAEAYRVAQRLASSGYSVFITSR
jgi:cell division septation protein DedD